MSFRYSRRDVGGNSFPAKDDPIKMVYPPEEMQGRPIKLEDNSSVDDLMSQLNEALKREEAANDRLKLQETQFLKQISELRLQVKKLTVENTKLPKAPSSSSSYGSKLDKKKDYKSREVRELHKTINVLKYEKQELEKRANKLSQFIEFAANLKEKAALQCLEKDQMIFSLRKESVIATQIKVEEISRRCQLESELDSLRNYIDYIQHKKSETLRNKGVQTETTIPMRISYDSAKFTNPFMKANPEKPNTFGSKQKAYSNFKALESAVALWQTKVMEQEFQQQTKLMGQRFFNALEPDQGVYKKPSVKTANSLDRARERRFFPRRLSLDVA